MSEGIAKLHSESNPRFFRWIRFFAKRLWPIGYVALRKTEPTKKSSNLTREASFAIPSSKQSLTKQVSKINHSVEEGALFYFRGHSSNMEKSKGFAESSGNCKRLGFFLKLVENR